MNKIKSFLMCVALLIMTFVIIVVVALIYRANDRMSIKSYIFQINSFASQRVGNLQNINDMSADDLRNKLIKKYVSEYFKVIPGDKNVENRSELSDLSMPSAYKQWQDGEAKIIAKMSEANMLRIVKVRDEDIATINRPADYDYKTEKIAKPIYYTVRYSTITWPKPNEMDVQPVFEKGIINIEAKFKPGITEEINGEKYNLRKYLESNKKPAGLFMFKVTNIGDKGIL